ncbi:MAG TPA: hypothetical protein VHY08_16950, partial [Bacillota bacterium]|nr:hypothetical protein [Bacillota bacterium]
FHRFEFKFAIPEEEPKEDTGSEAPEGTPAATEGQEPTGEEPTGQDLNVPEIEFAANGGCSNLSMPWETEHFAGTLEVKESGEIKWAYAKKAKETKDSL